MIARIIELVSAFIVATISTLGYGGVVLLMAIESACIPLPSEVIMPFSGYLVYTGQFNLWIVTVAGAFGCVLGSLLAFVVILANPYGVDLLTFPVQLLSRGDVLSHIVEWRSPDFRKIYGMALALWVVVFVLYITRFQIIPEEHVLASLFGAEYEAYKGRVRRWI